MKEKIKEMLMEQMRMLHERAKERKDAETLSYLTGAMCEIARTVNVKVIDASRIEEAAKSMNMSVKEMIAFYGQHDEAYAAKLRDLSASGESDPKA